MHSTLKRASVALAVALSLAALPAFAALSDSTDTRAPAPAAADDASSRFRSLVGGDDTALERTYRTHAERLRQQTAAGDALQRRVSALDSSTQAMLAEWSADLGSISDDSLRGLGQVRLDSARARHARELASMNQAVATSAPALAALRDRTLALRHALDDRAVRRLSAASTSVRADAARLRQASESAAAAADSALAAIR